MKNRLKPQPAGSLWRRSRGIAMKLKRLSIKNFRNFEDVEVSLSNKNVVFGMNDVGKTNFLYALRFLLDRKVRNNGFQDSDYFLKDISRTIEICLEIDIEDRGENLDSQNIISKLGKSRRSINTDSIFIKLISKFDEEDFIGNPELFWGSDIEDLDKISQVGTYTELDKLFQVVYVDPLIDLDKIFSANKRKIFSKKKDNDNQVLAEIDNLADQINEKIAMMESVSEFQDILSKEYKSLKYEDIAIVLRSEMAIKGVFNDIHPYITKNSDTTNHLYPTSGDGRRKILAYSLLNHITNEFNTNNLISIYLIEEPENSLHRSMQISLSKQLFNKDVYRYFIMSTHSSEMLYEMDKATLIRIHSADKIYCNSYLYIVDETFRQLKKELNESLATALFADRVLLIEGPSEKVLFEKILSVVAPNYELQGGFILQVDGIKFKPYFRTLNALGIKCIVKTDNDLRETIKQENRVIEAIGYNRCATLAVENFPSTQIPRCRDIPSSQENKDSLRDRINKHENVEKLRELNIYLSKVDLENDLYDAIPTVMNNWKPDAVAYLQKQKLLRMLSFCDGLIDVNCQLIYDHENFECLKKLTGEL